MKPSFIIMALFVLLSTFGINVEAINGAETGQNQIEVVTWSFKTGGSIYAKPLVLDGVVYIGSLDSNFYALNVLTGLEIWRYKTDNQIYSSAAYSENTLCFESGNKLYGLDLNGGLKWTAQLAEGPVTNRHDDWDDYHSSPKIADGVAYVGSEEGRVFGVNVADGTVVFQVQSPEPRSTVETTPTIYNGKVYFGDWNGIFYAYDLTTSQMAWKYDTRNDNTYSWVNDIQDEAVVWNNAIYFGGRISNLYSLDPETGARNWMFHDPGDMWLLGGPVIADGILYMGSSNQCVLRGFNPLTGDLLWTQNVDYRIFGTPVVDGDFIFFGTGFEYNEPRGSFYAADRVTGQLVNRIAFEGQVHSSPAIQNGILYFGCADGNVFAVDRDRFLANPLPNTGFKDKVKIAVGDIPGNEADRQVSVTVFNAGTGDDSVTISLNMSPALVSSNAITLDPPRFLLAGNDSQVVTLGIDATKLKAAKYQAIIIMTSKSNMTTRSQNKLVTFTVTSVSDVESGIGNPPRTFSVGQNYPNPFNVTTAVEYSVAGDALVSLKVFDLLGEEVAVLVDGFKQAGNYRASFDATGLTSGIYFYQYQAGEKKIVRKMSLLK